MQDPDPPITLEVRKIEGPKKHPTTREKFNALEPGQSLTPISDPDPRPLYSERRAEKPDRFDDENDVSHPGDDRGFVAAFPTRTGSGA